MKSDQQIPDDPILTHNKNAWNRLVRAGNRFTSTATEAAFANPLAAVDSLGWLGPSIVGQAVLCLAAGGGRQAPLYAAAGAKVTVVDLSDEMLVLDRQVAQQRKLPMRILQGSMDDLSMLGEGEFDLVIHPVSTCYLKNIQVVFQQVARVLRAGGVYVSQHKSPTSLQVSRRSLGSSYVFHHGYYDKNPVEAAEPETTLREPGTLEFVHRVEEIIGGICRAGMTVEDLVEPFHADTGAELGSFGHRSCFVAPYLRIKARRTGTISAPRLFLET